MKINVLTSFLALTAVVFASGSMTRADDQQARTSYGQALDLYQQRGQAGKIDQALSVLASAETQVTTDNALKYDIFILEARAYFWQGTHAATNDDKKRIHLAGQQKADQAKTLNPSYADGYYFAGVNLARWAEANGVIASISHKGQLEQYMKDSSDPTRTTRDGKTAESVDGYGPDRVLGRMFQKLPGILGGDHNKSLQHLDIAVQKAPELALNTVFLADTLMHGSNDEKAQAKKMLQDLLTHDPSTFDSDRVPETREEFVMAQGLLDGKPLP